MGKKILQKKHSLFLFIILMILSLIPLSGCGEDQRQLSEEKTKMVQYLEKKYARQFVVESIRFYSRMLGAPKQVEAKVHPKDNKELIIMVYKYLEEDYSYPILYYENYLGTLWAQQANGEVYEFLKTIYDVVPEFTLRIVPSDVLVNQINGKVPSIDEVLNEANKEIVFKINIFTTVENNDLNLLEHAEKVFKLIEFTRSKNIENPMIYYLINIDKQNNNSKKYICSLSKEEIKLIKKPAEVIQFFDKYGGE